MNTYVPTNTYVRKNRYVVDMYECANDDNTYVHKNRHVVDVYEYVCGYEYVSLCCV